VTLVVFTENEALTQWAVSDKKGRFQFDVPVGGDIRLRIENCAPQNQTDEIRTRTFLLLSHLSGCARRPGIVRAKQAPHPAVPGSGTPSNGESSSRDQQKPIAELRDVYPRLSLHRNGCRARDIIEE
jgi:hypothetical protein